MNLFTASLLLVLSMASPGQAIQANLESDPRRERLGKAIERGNVDLVRAHLDAGGDVNEAWRDLPPQVVRSLLLRSVWYGQERIFRLLLDRGADVATVNGYLGVGSGNVEIVRTLLARGVKPGNKGELLYVAMQRQDLAMIELLWSPDLALGLSASDLPVYFLTKDITRLLVPKYVGSNARTALGNEPCAVAIILGAYRRNWDGCEWATGPLWLHFVVTGNTELLQYLLDHGADLRALGEFSTHSDLASFSAMDIARARKDKPMIQLLRRAGLSSR
jgi:ankyrin repeat protein